MFLFKWWANVTIQIPFSGSREILIKFELGLAGKKAVVVAGARGIGRATAENLAGEGTDVAICARGKDDVQQAVVFLASPAASFSY